MQFATLVDLPLAEALVRELYVQVGLSSYHVGLLCGVGALSAMNRLRALGLRSDPAADRALGPHAPTGDPALLVT